MPRKIVIIGAHAAGVDAASAARKADRKAEITLMTKQKMQGYSPCGIPYVIGGQIPSFDDLVVFPPSYFRMMKLDLRLETTANKIDTEAKTVEIEDKKGKEETLEYDSLILTTGAYPFMPPIKGRDKQGVYVVRTIQDGKRINAALENTEHAVVVGAGVIGLETAAAFVERGVETTVVELLPYALPAMLDKDMADRVQEMLEDRGLKIIVGESAQEFVGQDRVTGVSVAGETIPADLVVVATGVKANVELAKEAGIDLGQTGGIKTGPRMETSVEDVYAAGDCVQSINMITKRPMLCQLGTAAVKQAKVAGTNAAGGYTIFPGVLGSAVTKLFDIEVGVTGLNQFFANRAGMQTVAGALSSKTKADYYPGGLPIRIKIVVEKESHRLVGGQIIGGEAVTQRINALSFAIQKQMTVQELAKADTAYAPPVNETWEPMIQAAEIAIRRL